MTVETAIFYTALALLNVALFICLKTWGVINWLQYRVPEWLWPSRCLFCFMYRVALVEVLVGVWLHRVPLYEAFDTVILAPLVMAVISLKFTPAQV